MKTFIAQSFKIFRHGLIAFSEVEDLIVHLFNHEDVVVGYLNQDLHNQEGTVRELVDQQRHINHHLQHPHHTLYTLKALGAIQNIGYISGILTLKLEKQVLKKLTFSR